MAENFNEKKSYTSEIDFTPEPLNDVFKKKFGSEKELVTLFIALLKIVEIEDVYPAVILSPNNRFSKVQEKYAVTDFMEKICVYWHGDLYSPGNSYMPFTFAAINEANVLVGNNKYELVKYATENSPNKEFLYDYFIDNNSAKVEVKAHYSGSMNLQKRQMFLNMPDVQRKIWFNQLLGEKSAKLLDGPNFLNFDKIDENLKMTYTLEYSDFLVDQKPYKYFKLLSSNFSLDVSLDERDNNYQISEKISIKDNFVIDISHLSKDSDKIELLNATNYIKEFIINDKTAYFKMEAKIDGDKIVVDRVISIPECIVPNNKYPEFKQFILSIKNPINNMIFLK